MAPRIVTPDLIRRIVTPDLIRRIVTPDLIRGPSSRFQRVERRWMPDQVRHDELCTEAAL